MKDAKGHGSNPRGGAAHQEGVKALDRNGMSQADIIKRALLIQQRDRQAFQAEAAHQTGIAGISKSGAALDRDGNPIEDLNGTPVRIDPDGKVTLYHRTTPESAAAIYKSGRFSSRENTDETFFSNQLHGAGEGYGNSVVTVRVRPELLRMSDAFRNGEVHVAVSNARLSKKVLVK